MMVLASGIQKKKKKPHKRKNIWKFKWDQTKVSEVVYFMCNFIFLKFVRIYI